MATVLYGFTMFMWWLPIASLAPFSIAHHLDEDHVRWHPLWEWLGQPVALLPFLIGCSTALLGLAIAALPRLRAERTRTIATG